jgi:hypothetical protein
MMTDKLRAAAKAALDWLRDEKLNQWTYMEGSQFYADRDKQAEALEAALAEPEQVTHPFEDASVISALYWASILIEKEYPVGHNGADSWLMNYSDKHGENVRRHDHREWEKVHGRWKPKAALAEPTVKDSLTNAEQEPVACIKTNGELMWLKKPEVVYSKPRPLYAAPPRREWAGLTDEEITEIRLKMFDAVATNYEAYRAIETKLREKNT